MATEFPAAETANAAGSPKRWRSRIVLVLLAAVGIPVGACIVYTFPPSQYDFYPRCIFYSVTGLHCAGCGATRCVGALLHGNVEQAFAYNPLFLIMLPYLGFAAGGQIFESWTGKKVRLTQLPRWLAIGLVVMVVAFSIARNIDVYPFTLLAPHEI
jgi:Protein of unknown function (DUF2752)